MKEVVIVSTIHKPTKRYSNQDLYALLDKIKPSTILEESPPEFYDESGNMIYPKKDTSQEGYAIRKYVDLNNAKVKPFDMKRRQEVLKELGVFKNEEEIFKILEMLDESGKFGENQNLIVQTCYSMFKCRDAVLKNGNWRDINSIGLDKIIEYKNAVLDKMYMEVIPSIKELAQYTTFCKSFIKFWDARNVEMCKNISKLAEKDAITAVLTGAEHRYTFMKLFKSSDQIKFVSVENYLESKEEQKT